MKNRASIENIYHLEGRVPLHNAVAFGLQHVLLMFVANLTPVTMIAASASPALESAQVVSLLQNAMLVAGIATLIQLYPIRKIGSGLPIVMGVSFTFVTALSAVGAKYGYPSVIGAVMVGGVFEGVLGFLARYWHRFIRPIVSATVVTCIGLSLFPVATRSFAGGYAEDFGSMQNLLLGTVTLVSCLLWTCFAKGYRKRMSILFGLIVGYVTAVFMGKVDLSAILSGGVIALPRILPFKPEFHPGAILSACIIFIVSAVETIGDTSALTVGGLNRSVRAEEISGSLAVDGLASTFSAVMGCTPITSFSQNVGLIAMTKVVNRFTIMTGAVCMIFASLFPPIGNFFASVPEPVFGGCTIMMFGNIMVSGIRMIADAGFSAKNVTTAALALSIGIGFTSPTENSLWSGMPQLVQDVFAENCVAVVFVLALILSLVLPENIEWGKNG